MSEMIYVKDRKESGIFLFCLGFVMGASFVVSVLAMGGWR